MLHIEYLVLRAESNSMRKGRSFHMDILMQKKKKMTNSLYPPPYTKINLKWTSSLNARAKTTQLLEYIGGNLMTLSQANISFFFFFFGHNPWHVGSQFPKKGSIPCALQWKHRVLTTGLPGKYCLGQIFLKQDRKSMNCKRKKKKTQQTGFIKM